MRYFYANTDTPFQYLTCGILQSQSGFLHQRRSFDVNVLILVREGTLYIAQNKNEYSVHAGEYVILPAGEEHFGFQASDGELSYFWVHFLVGRNAQLKTMQSASFDLHRNSLAETNDSTVMVPEYSILFNGRQAEIQVNQILALSHNEQLFNAEILDYAVSLLILYLAQDFAESAQDETIQIPHSVTLIKEWVKANYSKPINVKSIAKEFCYHPDYLSLLFKKSTKQTMISYINQTRIEISKNLLLYNDITIKEAAYSCGFSDCPNIYEKLYERAKSLPAA